MSNPILSIFGWNVSSNVSTELPVLYRMGIEADEFLRTDIRNIYQKILTDTLERTQGIPEKFQPLLWDNCLQSESSSGLVNLLAEAMESKADLAMIVNKSLGTIRKATSEERQKIDADYKANGKSPIGVFVSFRNYDKTDMIRLYSALEYCVIASLNKTLNLAKSVQFKMSEMRGTVNLKDSKDVVEQGISIATQLAAGKDVMLDKEDEIVTATPDVTAIKEGMAFIDSKRSFYLGMPISYINGEQTTGIGSTGEADAKATDRGLKSYFFSIIKPVVEAVFECSVSFKSQDITQIDAALNALKVFDLVGENFLSAENKLLVINKLLGVDGKLEKPAVDKVEAPLKDNVTPIAPRVEIEQVE